GGRRPGRRPGAGGDRAAPVPRPHRPAAGGARRGGEPRRREPVPRAAAPAGRAPPDAGLRPPDPHRERPRRGGGARPPPALALVRAAVPGQPAPRPRRGGPARGSARRAAAVRPLAALRAPGGLVEVVLGARLAERAA